MYVLQLYDVYVLIVLIGMGCLVLYAMWWTLRFKGKNKEKEFFAPLIADSWIPKTYRSIFSLYLKWREKQ